MKRRSDQKIRMLSHVVCADLSKPAAETAAVLTPLIPSGGAGGGAGIASSGADAIVMNLALHYFAGSTSGLANIAALCAKLVRVGGTVNLTMMFGDRVHALLKSLPVGGAWSLGSPPKYSIKRLYESKDLELAGQKIGVLLPFSNGEYYEEYLVNTKTVAHEFELQKFQMVVYAPMQKYLQNYTPRGDPLTDIDITYVSLYGELVFKKLA
jgi:hypothetical protein